MFQSPFPSHVAFSVVDSLTSAIVPCLAQEEEILPPHTVEATRTGLRAGRQAAHAALTTLGKDDGTPILRQADRSPLWPTGVVGSISHARRSGRTLAVAAVGASARCLSIGVDVEDLQRSMGESLVRRVCTPTEMVWIDAVPEQRLRRALSIFSAKEALFKAFAPIFDGPKTFQGACLEFDPADSSFVVTLTPAMPPRFAAFSKHRVRMQQDDDFVLTTVFLVP
ncbi:MAG: 4'-phosphopantetheinyl transferase superfamily protein [Deltaproteobacteria bacterium]|nr:4'-phosphopantetheinyl transferase superfamily protein [Deltaproteobacteria bacterium]